MVNHTFEVGNHSYNLMENAQLREETRWHAPSSSGENDGLVVMERMSFICIVDTGSRFYAYPAFQTRYVKFIDRKCRFFEIFDSCNDDFNFGMSISTIKWFQPLMTCACRIVCVCHVFDSGSDESTCNAKSAQMRWPKNEKTHNSDHFWRRTIILRHPLSVLFETLFQRLA